MNETFENAHVLDEHVGKSDWYLQDRLSKNQDINLASTFPDQRTATSAIAQALKASQSQIRRYIDTPSKTRNEPFTVDVGFNTGRVWVRGANSAVSTTRLKVVIRKPAVGGAQPSTGYYIVTAYPSL